MSIWQEEGRRLAAHMESEAGVRPLEPWEQKLLAAARSARDGGPRPERKPWRWSRTLAAVGQKRSGYRVGQ